MVRLENIIQPADLLAEQMRHAGLPGWGRETLFIPGRKFRADFIWRTRKLIVEMDGGTWARKGAKKCWVCGHTPQGRHSTGTGRERDCEKQALAVLAGYRYLIVTGTQVQSGKALSWIRAALV